jgi:beta-lactam-binding protein with PASTA domain
VVSALPDEESAAVPQIVDMPLAQAVSLLADTGFNNCFIYLDTDSEKPEGTVTAQKPEQGLLEPISSDVDLWISDYANKPFVGHFEASITIDEVESKVKIVLEDTIEGNTANFVISESVEDVGIRNYDFDMECITPGTKIVKVYINNNEISRTEVDFFVRNGID